LSGLDSSARTGGRDHGRGAGGRDGSGRGGDRGGSGAGGIGHGSRAAAPASSSQSGGGTAFSLRPSPSSLARGFQRRTPPCNSDEASRRNQELVAAMRAAVDAATFSRFRDSSGDFRSGALGARAYVSSTMELFGRVPALAAYLPELASLLPADHGLREALCVACEEAAPAPAGLGRTAGQDAGAGGRGRRSGRGGRGGGIGRGGGGGRGGSGGRSGSDVQSGADSDVDAGMPPPFNPEAVRVAGGDAESALLPFDRPLATSRADFPSLAATRQRETPATAATSRVGVDGTTPGSSSSLPSPTAVTPMVPTATYRLNRTRDLTSSAAHFPPLTGSRGGSDGGPPQSTGAISRASDTSMVHASTASIVRAGPPLARRPPLHSSWSPAPGVAAGPRPAATAAAAARLEPTGSGLSHTASSAARSVPSHRLLTDGRPAGRVWGNSIGPSVQATAAQRRRAAAEAKSAATASAALGQPSPTLGEAGVAMGAASRSPQAATSSRVSLVSFPTLGDGGGGDGRNGRDSSGGGGREATTSRTAGGGLVLPRSSGRVVLDVGALMRNRQASAVPQLGDNGLPWEQRKLASKAAAAKQDWAAASVGSSRQSISSSSAAAVPSTDAGSGHRGGRAAMTRVAKAASSALDSPASLSEAHASAGTAGSSSVEPTAPAADIVHDGAGAGGAGGSSDEYSYLDASRSEVRDDEDPAAAFLGS